MHSTEHVTIFTGTLKMLPLNLCNGPEQQNFRPIFKSFWPRYRSRVKYYPILFTEQRPRLLPDPDRTGQKTLCSLEFHFCQKFYCNYQLFNFVLLSYSMRSRVYETVERPSVCPSVPSVCGGFAAVAWRTGDRSIATWPALSSKRA